jgi:hypothetical protein
MLSSSCQVRHVRKSPARYQLISGREDALPSRIEVKPRENSLRCRPYVYGIIITASLPARKRKALGSPEKRRRSWHLLRRSQRSRWRCGLIRKLTYDN